MSNQYISDLFNLQGRKALITGASSGLGCHFARVLASAGAEVTVAARTASKLADTVDQITAEGGKARALPLDVTNRDSVIEALDAMGTPDIVVNNAGVTDTKRPLDFEDSDWDAIMDTNLKGAWIVAQESARRMAADERPGSIINVTSILASRVAGGVGPYCASKAGLAHLTKSLALELARHGIRVNSLAPGYVVTEINRDFLSSDAGEKLRNRIPTRRFGEYQNLEGALLLLASDAGSYMSGSEIVVDGGHLCSSL